MNETKINFINRSKDNSRKDIVFYQSNDASLSFFRTPIAWKVIKNCGIDESHLFHFNSIVEAAIGDSYGNYGPSINAETGRILEIVNGDMGEELQLTSKATHNPFEFDVLNGLKNGEFNVYCFRNERLLATSDSIYPGESVSFRFPENICIGVGSEIEEGEEIERSIVHEVQAQFDLTGIGSADIIMTGGGESDKDTPFEFKMENIERKVFKRDNLNFDQW